MLHTLWDLKYIPGGARVFQLQTENVNSIDNEKGFWTNNLYALANQPNNALKYPTWIMNHLVKVRKPIISLTFNCSKRISHLSSSRASFLEHPEVLLHLKPLPSHCSSAGRLGQVQLWWWSGSERSELVTGQRTHLRPRTAAPTCAGYRRYDGRPDRLRQTHLH